MNNIIKIPRLTKLSEPNVNGVVYDKDSLNIVISKFISNPHGMYNVAELYNGKYGDPIDPVAYHIINTKNIIGKCVDIQDDYVEVKLVDIEKFNNTFKTPVALFRMIGEGDRGNFKISEIIAIDIAEKSFL